MNPPKANTINVVQLIADVDRQKEYERSVPITDVLAELVCQWFDDCYHSESRLYRDIHR